MAGVAVYVFAAVGSAFLIGAVAYARDASYHDDPASILGLGLLAAAPLLVLGVPFAVGLLAVTRWSSPSRRIARPVAFVFAVALGAFELLMIVNFHADSIAPESLAYLIPWGVFGATFPLGGPPARVTFQNAD